MSPSSRIVANTVVMYSRYILTAIVTLFSARWVLLALGEIDFGIFNLIAGMLAMLMVLNLSMSTTTQRFLSNAYGKNDEPLVKRIFSHSIILHFTTAIIIVLLIEIIGFFLLKNFLSVPVEKINDAFFILHCLTISCFISIFIAPFNAALIAHENMLFVSIIQITESILKFLTAFLLLQYNGNRLKLYAMLMMMIPIASSLGYILYCKNKYEECHFSIPQKIDFGIIKKMCSFCGFSLIGWFGSLLKTQGLAMLLNSFFGVFVNAAYGIANQINGQLLFVSNAVYGAARPQIIRNESENNHQRMLELTESVCKITFLIFATFAIPICFEMHLILEIWLKKIPAYTESFAIITISANTIAMIANGVTISIEAVGNIKLYQLVISSLRILVFPFAFILLKLGYGATTVLMVIVVEEICNGIAKLIIAKHITGLDLRRMITKTILPSMVIITISILITTLVYKTQNESILRFTSIFLVNLTLIPILSYTLILTDKEKKVISRILMKILNKIGYRNNKRSCT